MPSRTVSAAKTQKDNCKCCQDLEGTVSAEAEQSAQKSAEEEVLLYDEKKSQKRDLIFTSSPARVCQGDYEDETFFDKPSFVQVVTYVVVTSRVLQPCPVQGYEGVHHLHHLHLCPDVQECEGDEQVA